MCRAESRWRNAGGKGVDLYLVAERLARRYQDFNHNNPRNPLANLIFVICSVQTTKNNYERVYRGMRRRFPTFQSLYAATERELATTLAVGGLAKQKARSIKSILGVLVEEFGKPTLAPLRAWSAADCERFLRSLPGVGTKVARCVMMSTLDHEVFPVDTHCWRICRRLGWVGRNPQAKYCSEVEMDEIQDAIPRPIRFSLHVNMISLGREHCLAGRPRCEGCPIDDLCPKHGVLGR